MVGERIDPPLATSTTVQIIHTGGTGAAGGSDYARGEAVEIFSGSARLTVESSITDDGLHEPDEYVTFALASPSLGILGAHTNTTVTIHNAPPSIEVFSGGGIEDGALFIHGRSVLYRLKLDGSVDSRFVSPQSRILDLDLPDARGAVHQGAWLYSGLDIANKIAFLFPAPLDTLLTKLRRLDEKSGTKPQDTLHRQCASVLVAKPPAHRWDVHP